MRKLLVILLLTLLVAGCSKREGLKTVSNGWDVTLEGRVYQYRCEPDGFYLYINWDGEESYKMEFLWAQRFQAPLRPSTSLTSSLID